MSNALAIAHVTQALALLIEDNLRPEIGMAVKVEPRKPPADPPADPTITVFLYQVTPNTSQRNNDVPTRASDGTLLKRPAAALDLHFVISAYGEETELVGQRLIGSVVRTLHEIPVLPKDIIEQAGEKPHLAGSDLAEAVQRVRFTPTVMDIDETSKLWGMLHQTPYSLSVVYQAALVFIEGRETPVPAKPVERQAVRVLPFGAPGAPVPPGGAQASAEGAGGPPAPADSGASEKAPGKAVEKAVGGTPAKAPARPGAKAPAKAVAKVPAKAESKAPAKAAAKAPARTRKAAGAAKSAGPGKSGHGTAKSTGAAPASDSSAADGPEGAES
ncbi:Pvc16 family protein [Streptomyces sp. 2A115]|uniref:Pvc16 family protein n=1 Tax=Streptomyces sp. 2A115 TaxID=3457439 RepID=UPI003FD5930B